MADTRFCSFSLSCCFCSRSHTSPPQVFLTGSFNNWEKKIPLNLSHGDFTVIQDLPPGEHEYRFIVDGQWRTDPALPRKTHVDGQDCNLSAVSLPDPATSVASASRLNKSPVGSYSDSVLDEAALQSEIAKFGQNSGAPPSPAQLREPPAIPPHLRRALLNTAPLGDRDPSLLPLPHHVMLNHFYALPRDEEAVVVLGITRRWRGEGTQKFVTTVLYKPSPIGVGIGVGDTAAAVV
jgi:5'-AMP-activated protein kinase, regulatory beta subunit